MLMHHIEPELVSKEASRTKVASQQHHSTCCPQRSQPDRRSFSIHAVGAFHMSRHLGPH